MQFYRISINRTVGLISSRSAADPRNRYPLGAGCERGDVLTMVLTQGFRVILVGVALGLAGAWVSTRLLETLLFGVRPTDAAAFAWGSGVLVLAVLLACYIPARRVTMVDPTEALRHE